MAGQKIAPLLEKLRGRSDVVLVEGPPLLAADVDLPDLMLHTDGALLVVRHGRTTAEQVARAAAALQFARSRLLGVVLTMVPASAELGVWAAPAAGTARSEPGLP